LQYDGVWAAAGTWFVALVVGAGLLLGWRLHRPRFGARPVVTTFPVLDVADVADIADIA